MPDHNGEAIAAVYQNAERLFLELRKVKKVFREHALLGTVDLEALVTAGVPASPVWRS